MFHEVPGLEGLKALVSIEATARGFNEDNLSTT